MDSLRCSSVFYRFIQTLYHDNNRRSVITVHSDAVTLTMLWQIQFWKLNKSANYRTEDIVFRIWNPCPLVAIGNKQVRQVTSVALPEHMRQPEIVTGATNRLWPYSRLAAAVRTMNGASGGNLSNIVVFDTPEGGLWRLIEI